MIKEINLDNIYSAKFIDNSSTANMINIDKIRSDLQSNPFTKYIVYIINNEVVAFTNYLMIYEKIEIVDIVVKEEFRQQKIASKMLTYIIDEGIKNRCENITLEVDKNNIKAINLYYKFGFKQVAIREQYYDNNDGLLMEKKLVN